MRNAPLSSNVHVLKYVHRPSHTNTDPGHNAVVVVISIPLQTHNTGEKVFLAVHLQAERLHTSLSLCLCFFFFFDFLCETEPLECDREQHEGQEHVKSVLTGTVVQETPKQHTTQTPRMQQSFLVSPASPILSELFKNMHPVLIYEAFSSE